LIRRSANERSARVSRPSLSMWRCPWSRGGRGTSRGTDQPFLLRLLFAARKSRGRVTASGRPFRIVPVAWSLGSGARDAIRTSFHAGVIASLLHRLEGRVVADPGLRPFLVDVAERAPVGPVPRPTALRKKPAQPSLVPVRPRRYYTGPRRCATEDHRFHRVRSTADLLDQGLRVPRPHPRRDRARLDLISASTFAAEPDATKNGVFHEAAAAINPGSRLGLKAATGDARDARWGRCRTRISARNGRQGDRAHRAGGSPVCRRSAAGPRTDLESSRPNGRRDSSTTGATSARGRGCDEGACRTELIEEDLPRGG